MLSTTGNLTTSTVADDRLVEAIAWLARQRAWEARLRALTLRPDPAPVEPVRRVAPTPALLARAS